MTVEPYKKSVENYLKQASAYLSDAQLLHEKQRFSSATDRVYYAMFWATRAALVQRGIFTKTHKGLINQFSKEFVKTNTVSFKLFQYLQEAFDLRQETTYETGIELTKERIDELLERAEEFITKIQRIIEK